MRKVNRIAAAIRAGTYKKETKTSEITRPIFLLWEADTDAVAGYNGATRGLPPITAPKEKLPGHAASYNPPPEYLLTDEERKEWEATPPENRRLDMLPVRFSCLRHVPAYSPAVRERFERSLDLYLCPRAVRQKMAMVDPETLLPSLPDPSGIFFFMIV